MVLLGCQGEQPVSTKRVPVPPETPASAMEPI